MTIRAARLGGGLQLKKKGESMSADPAIPTPSPVDTEHESKLAAQVQAMNAAAMAFRSALTLTGRAWKPDPGKHVRSGVTKNKSQGQSKRRRVMTRESRRKNR